MRKPVGELSAVAYKADGAYLHGVRGDFPYAGRKSGPVLLVKEVVANFECVAGRDVEKYGVHAVGLYCGEDFGAD